MSQDYTTLVQEAQKVLEFNWTGEYTRPSPRLYPHQWSWDSAFTAIGYAHWDQRRAIKELTHLFDSQWKNGLLPQIVFDPHFGEYFPTGSLLSRGTSCAPIGARRCHHDQTTARRARSRPLRGLRPKLRRSFRHSSSTPDFSPLSRRVAATH